MQRKIAGAQLKVLLARNANQVGVLHGASGRGASGLLPIEAAAHPGLGCGTRGAAPNLLGPGGGEKI